MSDPSPFNSLLVPTDFSDASRDAFDWALRSIDRNDSSIIVLHVVSEAVIETIASHQFASREEVASRMRQYGEAQLSEYQELAEGEVEIDTIVCEGMPFLEILRKSEDFAVDAIVMGRVGTKGHFEKLLFGSTAEKVLRGARRPVIVLPPSDQD